MTNSKQYIYHLWLVALNIDGIYIVYEIVKNAGARTI